MLRIYRQPRKPFLYQQVEEIRKLVKCLGLKIAYRHVPRRLNSVPDTMCRMALTATKDVSYLNGELPPDVEVLNLS
jgi:hypothetical protein